MSVYNIELLTNTHAVDSFECGVESKNNFLRKFALQNTKGGLGRTFVAVLPSDPTKIYGYYTIATGAVNFASLPVQNLPRYPIPTVHIGKLAIDRSAQRQGLGSALLFDALKRAASVADEIGIFAVEVIALDEQAKQFYIKHNFIEMLDSPMHLYLSMKLIRKMFRV